MSRKKSSPLSPRETCCAVLACIQPISLLEKLWAQGTFWAGQAIGRFYSTVSRSMWFDVFGSGSYASKRVGFRAFLI
jgi:hypothetical protein